MSEEDIRSQISAKEDEITRVEEEAAKKDASAEKEVESEYDPKIAEATTTLSTEEGLRDEAIDKAAEWTQTKKEKIAAAKTASKTLSSLKSDKTKALNDKLKAIGTEKKNAIKALQKEISASKKELSKLEKAKAKAEKAAAAAED
ncbi:hypothetical protein LCGC14_0891320 [marine sediment metagenome]|uniref:Uncharacterized protein n=1 Tax=marine sediment metagenome TaxID=412755 RepID=A0A0F9S663_9ZZZZ|nr:MAG: hypothetical protein Lokiarch_31420 [Candidatus Lokiarchaeum sp. GC14_75]